MRLFILKIVAFVLFLSSYLLADVYYSRIEPYEMRYIASDVTGIVTYIDEDKIGKILDAAPYIKIDAEIDTQELAFVEQKLSSLRSSLEASKTILKNLEESLKRKRENYERVKSLKIKSKVEKDREFYELVNTQNAYLNTQKEINNFAIQLADLTLRKVNLEKSLREKNLRAKSFMLYAIDVKVGQFVNKGTPLAKLADISKGLLSIYLSADELQNIEKKIIYIDGKKTAYKLVRVEKIADSVSISKYKAQIIVDAPKIFSKLVKVELRDE